MLALVLSSTGRANWPDATPSGRRPSSYLVFFVPSFFLSCGRFRSHTVHRPALGMSARLHHLGCVCVCVCTILAMSLAAIATNGVAVFRARLTRDPRGSAARGRRPERVFTGFGFSTVIESPMRTGFQSGSMRLSFTASISWGFVGLDRVYPVGHGVQLIRPTCCVGLFGFDRVLLSLAGFHEVQRVSIGHVNISPGLNGFHRVQPPF